MTPTDINAKSHLLPIFSYLRPCNMHRLTAIEKTTFGQTTCSQHNYLLTPKPSKTASHLRMAWRRIAASKAQTATTWMDHPALENTIHKSSQIAHTQTHTQRESDTPHTPGTAHHSCNPLVKPILFGFATSPKHLKIITALALDFWTDLHMSSVAHNASALSQEGDFSKLRNLSHNPNQWKGKAAIHPLSINETFNMQSEI